MSAADKNRARQLKTCQHFNGLQHDICDAGVAYDQLRQNSCDVPCLPPFTDKQRPVAVCPKFIARTPEQLDEREKLIESSIRNIGLAREAIIKISGGGKGKSRAGRIDCPVCKIGSLSYSVSGYNGHVHAACSTQECVRWME